MSSWLYSLALSLVLTLAIELGFALITRKRGRDLLLVALVNLVTNPTCVLVCLLLIRYTALPRACFIAPLELLAFAAEALYYKKYSNAISRPWLFSLCANALSFGLGLFISLVL